MQKLLWTLALGSLTYGLATKEYLDVLQKAIIICLECVGIG